MALHGVEIRNAMELALAELTPERLSYEYRLIFEDNQLNSGRSAAAAHKLVSLDRVDAIVTLWPPTASVVAPITERSGVLHYTIVWDPGFAKRNDFLLSHQVMVGDIAHTTLNLLVQNGKRKVAFFHLEETGFNLGAAYIRKLAPEHGVELVEDVDFPPTETDFRALIEKSVKQNPNCYLIWSVMPTMDILIRQIRSRLPEACITGYLDYAEDLTQIENSPHVSEMFAAPFFTDAYRAKYGDSPKSKGANAYDILKLLVRAFESSPGRKLSAKEAKSFLTTLGDVEGAVGKFSVDPDGNSGYQPVVREVVDSQRKLQSGEGGSSIRK